MIDVDVKDQTGSALITAYSSTNSGNKGANWALDASCIAPTVASITVSGRVLNYSGRGIRQARVALVDGEGQIHNAVTNPFGYYRFLDIFAGQTIVVSVSHKTALFADATRVLTVTEESANIDFVANNQ